MKQPQPSAASESAHVGARLRRLRKQRRLTQAELARQIGIQQSDLSRMEKGEYRVSLDNLFKLLSVFDVDIATFFGASRPQAQPVSSPLSQSDMQLLHMMRELGADARAEVQEFVEFKVRRERLLRRDASRSDEQGHG